MNTTRNHIARANRKVNRPKVFRAQKGKGSYRRVKLNVRAFA